MPGLRLTVADVDDTESNTDDARTSGSSDCGISGNLDDCVSGDSTRNQADCWDTLGGTGRSSSRVVQVVTAADPPPVVPPF